MAASLIPFVPFHLIYLNTLKINVSCDWLFHLASKLQKRFGQNQNLVFAQMLNKGIQCASFYCLSDEKF